jgi:dUTPase
MIVSPVQKVLIEEIEEYTETTRACGGFGSTGK